MEYNYREIYSKLENWIVDNNFKSYDLCDVKGSNAFLKAGMLNKSGNLAGKMIAYPFIYLSNNHAGLLRKILSLEKKEYPQANALIVNSYLNLYRKTNDDKFIGKANVLLEWLMNNRSESFKNFCWGQPYDWNSRKIIKKFTPRTTVSSQAASAFIDMYNINNDSKYLDVAASICEFYINDLKWSKDKDGHICFSYTTEDNFHIHNANMLAASVLIRVWKLTGNESYKEFGVNAANFTIKYQNEDGSWYYWAPPDKIVGKIDHYHTGFILESFSEILEVIHDHSFENAFHKGIQYYNKELFTKDLIPKYTNTSLYPIDIQSLAQAIITYAVISKKYPEYLDKAKQVANWTIEHMWDSQGYFYYRINKNGKLDKSAYIRWAESWMMRALSLLI